MFVFLDFVLENVRLYTNIIDLCITSSKSVGYIKDYYVCHRPTKLPFPLYKLSRRSTDTWDKFTDYVLSKPLFRTEGKLRIFLCVLLDFLKAEKSFYADPTIVPFPRYNICISCGKGYPLVPCGMLDTCNAYERIPFVFTLRSKSCSNVLRGIVYAEHDYLYHKSFSRAFFGDQFTKLYREEFHVVQTLDRTFILVFLSNYGEDDVVKKRCNLRLHDSQVQGQGQEWDQDRNRNQNRDQNPHWDEDEYEYEDEDDDSYWDRDQRWDQIWDRDQTWDENQEHLVQDRHYYCSEEFDKRFY
jgi:hypothetical protein